MSEAPIVTLAAMDHARRIMSSRLNNLGPGSGSAVRAAGHRSVVDLPLAQIATPADRVRAEKIVGPTAHLGSTTGRRTRLRERQDRRQPAPGRGAVNDQPGGTTSPGDGTGGMML